MRPTKVFLLTTLVLIVAPLWSVDRLHHRTEALAYDEVALPDYEKEARIVFQGTCDQGRVNYTTYWKRGGYVLEVALLESKGTFYMWKRYFAELSAWGERYFMQASGSSNIAEFSHDEWDEKIKVVSINYFNKLHDLQSSCSKMLVM